MPPQRYTIIDLKVLQELGGLSDLEALQQARREWIDEELRLDKSTRQAYWSEAVAVGSNAYIKQIQTELGARTPGRKNIEQDTLHVLKEPDTLYQPFYS